MGRVCFLQKYSGCFTGNPKIQHLILLNQLKNSLSTSLDQNVRHFGICLKTSSFQFRWKIVISLSFFFFSFKKETLIFTEILGKGCYTFSPISSIKVISQCLQILRNNYKRGKHRNRKNQCSVRQLYDS